MKEQLYSCNNPRVMYVYINCTPHDVTLFREEDCVLDPVSRHYVLRDPEATHVTFSKQEKCARCSSMETVVDIDGDGIFPIKIVRQTFGEVSDLPDPWSKVIADEGNNLVLCVQKYIVSAIVAQALKGQRDDLVIPSHTVYDEAGHIIGCSAFAVI